MKTARRIWLATAATLAAAAVVPRAGAQDQAARNRELYLYKGADRDARLLEGAKKEGQLSVYTSLNTRDSGPITQAFEKKYGLKVLLWRAGSEKVLQRAVTESRAGRHAFDVLETNGPEMEAMHREKLLAEFHSPYFKDLPAAAFPKHRHWVADRFNFFVTAWNTNLVKPDEVPASYADLLHPRFAGRVAVEAADTDWFGAIVKQMGEPAGLAYFRKLADSKPQVRSGHTLMAELLSSGELPLAVAIYSHAVEKLIKRGAPIKWKALQPTFARPNAIGVSPQAQHPHAALLFADFMLSPQGQQLIKDASRVPASLAVDSEMNRLPFEMIDPVISLDEDAKWEKLWTGLFLQGRKATRESE